LSHIKINNKRQVITMKARIPQRMGGQQNMQAMVKKAQKMQEDMTAKQEELEATEFKAASGGGAVEVTMTGKKEITNLTLKPEVVDPEDIEMLQDLIISAVNECIRNIEDKTNEEMEAITGGFNIPGMF
jgi:DNA-binding YbaB/EbfC family protein